VENSDVISIGPELEQSLAAISCCCDLLIDWVVFDQIMREAQENQVATKHYILHDSRRAQLSATVEEYEPETVLLRLDRGRCAQFDSITSAASKMGFDIHAYFLDRPQSPPRFVNDTIRSVHNGSDRSHPVLRIQLVAIRRLDAVTRCFLDRTGIRPTPYVVYSTNIRTMETRVLHHNDKDTAPYTIKNYR
jgi:hypothetical protein